MGDHHMPMCPMIGRQLRGSGNVAVRCWEKE